MKKEDALLLITSEFPPQPGGIGNHALHLALNLSQKGKKVTVITNHRDKNIVSELAFDQQLPILVKRVKRSDLVLLTYWNRLFLTIRFFKSHPILIASGKFSLWQVAAINLFFKSAKLVAVLHGSEINAGGRMSKVMTRWALTQFDEIIAVSNFTKELALQQNNSLKIDVINNGFCSTNTENRTAVTKTGCFPSLITIGNVSQRKGQHNVIKVLPQLKKYYPTILYHIVGIPTEKAILESLAKELGVSEHVVFHGILSDAEKQTLLLQSTIFLMLSDHLTNGDVEGFGIAVIEANDYGIPAIGSANSGISDAIKEGYSGKLVNPHDSTAVVTAFQDIVKNYSLYAENAKHWAKHFDWKIIIDSYIKLLER